MEQSGPFGESGLGLRVRGTRFIDDAGRQVLLHGVNMVYKEESRHWVGGWSDEDFPGFAVGGSMSSASA
ncbi:hypothetical protein FLT15_25275 [Paenibacillus thiaminolyticus]|uniref:hypothetical protein n=1 Tax=Paenibacillus thiaminolyticus TaxID=49283 RepID=UPI0011658674|nr:hypothetical protein [Paenibacillus thiaminolyticus]NGP61537.1 hypothetical protein [Paenibacillus thiaminolyticus]